MRHLLIYLVRDKMEVIQEGKKPQEVFLTKDYFPFVFNHSYSLESAQLYPL